MNKKYESEALIVTWKPDVCIHSAVCVKKLNPVFNSQRKPWIMLENAQTDQIKETIDLCPSGALSYQLKETEKLINSENQIPLIKVSASGPLILKNGCIVEDAEGNQITREGTVALCRCGASSNKPFCDGNHRKIGFIG